MGGGGEDEKIKEWIGETEEKKSEGLKRDGERKKEEEKKGVGVGVGWKDKGGKGIRTRTL